MYNLSKEYQTHIHTHAHTHTHMHAHMHAHTHTHTHTHVRVLAVCTRSVSGYCRSDSEREIRFKVSACVSAAAVKEGAGAEAGGRYGNGTQQRGTGAPLLTACREFYISSGVCPCHASVNTAYIILQSVRIHTGDTTYNGLCTFKNILPVHSQSFQHCQNTTGANLPGELH